MRRMLSTSEIVPTTLGKTCAAEIGQINFSGLAVSALGEYSMWGHMFGGAVF